MLENSIRASEYLLNTNWRPKVTFAGGEIGIDMGGLVREWYVMIFEALLEPTRGLFTLVPGSTNTYSIGGADPELLIFVGKLIARSILDRQSMGVYFSGSFCKQLTGEQVKLEDMKSEGPEMYNSREGRYR